ncbi:MAG: hypothetical protein ACI4IF_00955 [Acutalibacteraceae bacterium]
MKLLLFLFEIVACVFACYLVYREKDLIKFEHKVWIYTKAFFKAVVFSVRDKIYGEPVKEEKETVSFSNEEYEMMLASLNKNSKTADFKIAS